MELSKSELERLLKRQAEIVSADAEDRTQRYVGSLQEDFDHKLDAVLEATQPIEKIQQELSILKDNMEDVVPKIDATFEKVGEIAVDVEVIKTAVTEHERKLQSVS